MADRADIERERDYFNGIAVEREHVRKAIESVADVQALLSAVRRRLDEMSANYRQSYNLGERDQGAPLTPGELEAWSNIDMHLAQFSCALGDGASLLRWLDRVDEGYDKWPTDPALAARALP